MSEYQVIARKWRPQCFADVVGQEHLTRTLRNAIMSKRTAHAYLLVGPRGIGKTTTARILAKALNCENPQDGEPCCKCSSCLAVADGTSLDIIEIDAASQNSVDDVRSLREQVMFAPVNSKYKIYIVDEVHMLSKQAWNAFLKTLEEPPEHVKFIFATTEVHKVLPTIISRCQRFDLRRIPTTLIVERLEKIARAEGIPLSKSALEAIARAADGGMRDAQSLLDQVITFFGSASKGEPIDEKQVFSLFGLTSPEEMDALIHAVLRDDRADVIRALYALASQGRNLETLLDELTEELRAVMIALTVPEAETILECGSEALERYRTLGAGLRSNRVQSLLENLAGAGFGLRNALNKQVYLETALLKAMKEAYTVRLDEVLARINQLRQSGELSALEGLPYTPFAHLPAAPGNKPPGLTASNPLIIPSVSKTPGSVVADEPQAEIKKAPPVQIAPALKIETQSGKQPERMVSVVTDESWPFTKEELPALKKTESSGEVLSHAESESLPPSDLLPAAAEEHCEVLQSEDCKVSPELLPEEIRTISPALNAETPIVELPEEENPVETIQIEDVESIARNLKPPKPSDPVQIWNALTFDVREHLKNPLLADIMNEAQVIGVEKDTLRIGFSEESEEGHADAVLSNTMTLEECLSRLTDNRIRSLRVRFQKGVQSLEEHHRQAVQNSEQARQNIAQNQFVQKALTLFEGGIVDIHG